MYFWCSLSKAESDSRFQSISSIPGTGTQPDIVGGSGGAASLVKILVYFVELSSPPPNSCVSLGFHNALILLPMFVLYSLVIIITLFNVSFTIVLNTNTY